MSYKVCYNSCINFRRSNVFETNDLEIMVDSSNHLIYFFHIVAICNYYSKQSTKLDVARLQLQLMTFWKAFALRIGFHFLFICHYFDSFSMCFNSFGWLLHTDFKNTLLCVKSKMHTSKSANRILCVLDIPFFTSFFYVGKSRTQSLIIW